MAGPPLKPSLSSPGIRHLSALPPVAQPPGLWQSAVAPAAERTEKAAGMPVYPSSSILPRAEAAEYPQAVQELQEWFKARQVETLEAIYESISLKLSKAMDLINETSGRSGTRLDHLEARLEVALGDLETRLEAGRTEHRAALVQVRQDLDGQFAQLSGLAQPRPGAAGAGAEPDAQQEQERRELLIAFGAVRGDFESLRGETRRDVEELQQRVAQDIATLQGHHGLVSGDIEELQGRCSRLEQGHSGILGDLAAATAATQQAADDAQGPRKYAIEVMQNRLAGLQAEVEALRERGGGGGAAAQDAGALRAHLADEVQVRVQQAMLQVQGQLDKELEAQRIQLAKELEALRLQHSQSKTMIDALRGQQGNYIRQHGREIEALRAESERRSSDVEALRGQQGGGGGERAEPQQDQQLEELRDDLDALRSHHAEDIEALRRQQGNVAEALQAQLRSDLEAMQRQLASDAGSQNPQRPWNFLEAVHTQFLCRPG